MLIDDNDIKIAGRRKFISFDPTIHAGHIFIVLTVLVSTVTAWCTMQERIDLLEAYNLQRKTDNDTLTSIEGQHHQEILKQIADLQQDVTLILTKTR